MKSIIIALFLFASNYLSSQQIVNLKLNNHKYFNDLASASGVEIYKNNIYLVADDLPWLIELNNKWKVKNKYPISGITQTKNGRTPKKIKADFESMALLKYSNKPYMLILSSGSKKIKRDTAYLFSMNEKKVIAKKNIRPWYESIKKMAGIGDNDEINIEGLAVSKDKIYVLHRGNISGNFIAVSPQNELIDFLLNKTEKIPQTKTFSFGIVSEEGVTAGFSGACCLPNHKGLLVTASLETTEDVINDGIVLGSYLAYIPFEGMEKGIIELTPIMDKNGKILAKKQEGVVIVKTTKQGNYQILTISDNDDGTSDIFDLNFILK